jgi:hypothetical protein
MQSKQQFRTHGPGVSSDCSDARAPTKKALARTSIEERNRRMLIAEKCFLLQQDVDFVRTMSKPASK